MPKHKPKHHIVRIVVVPDRVARPRPVAAASAGAGGLTDRQLKAAEKFLKTQGASPAKPGVGPKAAVKGATLFERVKPTDIIVVARQPASVRKENGVRRVVPHSHEPDKAVLRVWTESDTIEWRCEHPFSIAKFERAGWKLHGTPPHPFDTNPRGKKAVVTHKPGRYSYRSSMLTEAANNQQYKATFVVGGQRVDPDIVCGSPPPDP